MCAPALHTPQGSPGTGQPPWTGHTPGMGQSPRDGESPRDWTSSHSQGTPRDRAPLPRDGASPQGQGVPPGTGCPPMDGASSQGLGVPPGTGNPPGTGHPPRDGAPPRERAPLPWTGRPATGNESQTKLKTYLDRCEAPQGATGPRPGPQAPSLLPLGLRTCCSPASGQCRHSLGARPRPQGAATLRDGPPHGHPFSSSSGAQRHSTGFTCRQLQDRQTQEPFCEIKSQPGAPSLEKWQGQGLSGLPLPPGRLWGLKRGS